MKRHKITAKVGDEIEITVRGSDKNKETYWSKYTITIDESMAEGDGMDDFYLSETTGVEVD